MSLCARPATSATLHVTCAAIVRGGRLLLARRADSGLWELPGGKRGPTETLAACLRREIDEELGCRVAVLGPLGRVRQRRFAGPDLLLHAFFCRLLGPEPRPLEHRALQWATPALALTLDLCPADRRLLAALPHGRAVNSHNRRRLIDKSALGW